MGKHWREGALVLALFAIVVALQVASGAYRAEFGGYPDEPAHYVTSVMVRDFIAQMHWFSPRQFADNYYAHYPKVAFGHWPPLLYAVLGLWMLIFSPSRASVLLELALVTTVLAFSLYAIVKSRFGWKAGAAAALLLVAIPEIQTYTDEVMAETLLVLTSFWAAIFFARYMDSERWQDSLWFGIFSSLAVLTKGNGWEIGFVPPVALVLTRRWRLLARPSFWLPALAIAVLCVPWQLWSFPLVHRGWTGGDQPNAAYSFHAMGQFLILLAGFLGPLPTAIAVVGIAVTVFRSDADPLWPVMLGLIFGVWIFHVIVPAGVESRKMIVAIPALILFLFAGGSWLAVRLHIRPAILTAVLAAAFAIQTFAIPHEQHFGFTEAAAFVAAQTNPRDLTVLVSSERDGEGLLISEVAMREHRPTHTLLRGTKVLSTSDWVGDSYTSLFANAADLETYLRNAHVGLVVVDTFAARTRYMHHHLLLDDIGQHPSEWELLKTFPDDRQGAPDRIQIYQFNPAAY